MTNVTDFASDSKPFSQNDNLNAGHYKSCVEERGLDPIWVQANCRSVTKEEASTLLGYETKSDGIWLEGCNGQGQFKPDKPWRKEGDKKAPKYRSGLGAYDAMLPIYPTDPYYWEDIEALKQRACQVNGHPCLLVTEGIFKAIAGCSNNLPTIALLGVEMGLTPKDADPQGKRYLVPTLEHFAKAGLGFIIPFDADCATNDNVIRAQRSLVHQLRLFKVPVYSATGLWTVEEGKGMDDYILNNGAKRFIEEVLSKAIDVEKWEKQFQEKSNEKRRPEEDILGAEIAEDYRNKLIYNAETNRWMLYELVNPGVWTTISHEFTESILDTELETRGITGYGAHSYITNVLLKMRSRLIARVWNETCLKDYLPFQNGVLDIKSRKLLPHTTGNRFTWQLPRNYDNSTKEFSIIERFLDESTGNNTAIKKVLYCYLNAIIKGRSDLQQFLHLQGEGGTGKSSFLNLAIMLIGTENMRSTSLGDFCGNRFESANCYKKRLVIFAGQDKFTGSLQKFKSLTGQDLISAEDKGQKGFQYKYDGMVIVASNNPIFVGNNSSWLKRRLILVPFNHRVDKSKCRNLEDEFKPELNALTSYLLDIPDEEVTRILKNSVDLPEVAEEIQQQWLMTDSIAAWLDQCLIHDPVAKTPIGSNKLDTSTLFGHYCQYCQDTNRLGKSLTQFSFDLIRFCHHGMNWTDVKKTRANKGYFICGLKIRDPEEEDDISYSSETISQPSIWEEDPFNPTQSSQGKDFDPTLDPTQCRHQPYTPANPMLEDKMPAQVPQPTQESVGSSTLHCVGFSVGLEPAPSKESVGCVGLEPSSLELQLDDDDDNVATSPLEDEASQPSLELQGENDVVAPPPEFQVGDSVKWDEADRTFQPGQRVSHSELGEGTVEQQIGNMVFCVFSCGRRSPYAKELTSIAMTPEQEALSEEPDFW